MYNLSTLQIYLQYEFRYFSLGFRKAIDLMRYQFDSLCEDSRSSSKSKSKSRSVCLDGIIQ